ncbi:hypothetical protein Poly30_17850 [Planctomycetes bacterium Poly30]|uniref:Uncharacterized protein n=1 Tax=Saltatorellus ferox TaxID=2528018 RepID=A0A518EQA7_9BACT|nr:hypothetical protein Poly30_17850 [Planctomycetes bacterium Poly30]
MADRPSLSSVPTLALVATSVLFASLGTTLALRGFVLGESGRGTQEPTLDAAAALIDHPRIEIRAGSSEESVVRGAALRLASAWRDLGHAGALASSAESDAETAGHMVVTRPFPESLPAESKFWASLGLTREGDLLVTGEGHAWPMESAGVAITLMPAHLERAGERLAPLELADVASACAGAITVIIGKTADSASVVHGLDALGRGGPPVAPRLVLWSEGQRVFEARLDERGGAILPGAEFSVVSGPRPAGERFQELSQRAAGIVSTIGSFGWESQAPRVLEWSSLAARARDGAAQRAGWYDAAVHALVVKAGVPASEDDALFAFAEAELLSAFGPPGTPWLARGLVHELVRSSGGFTLEEIESRSGAVTFDEIVGPGRGRNRMVLAPAEARLARCLCEELGMGVAEAWGLAVAGNVDLDRSLRERWKASLQRFPIERRSPSMRLTKSGARVEVKATASELASPDFLRELDRIAALGFRGIALEVHVPVAPPGATERRHALDGLGGWGRDVTIQGDGLVLACALEARSRGLDVTLAPRFVTSASGGAGRQQIHGSSERLLLYGERRALAMEGMAWLAEQAEATGLVVLDSEDMPWIYPDAASVPDPEALAALENTRRQALVYSAPFAGERFVFTPAPRVRDLALENLASPALRGLLQGPLAHVKLRVGLDVQRRLQGSGWRERSSSSEVAAEPARSEFALVGPWYVRARDADRSGVDAPDLSFEEDARLRDLSGAISAEAVPGAAGSDRPR